jgi:diacylglycerol kinase family enzyme
MEIAVLHNPTAGDRELSHRDLLALLRRAGYRPEYFSSKEGAWKKPHALRGAEMIVVAGGDGSVKKAILQLHGYELPFALLPLGTANNICASLGIVGKPKRIVATWPRARRDWIDLGIARGPWGERMFVESAGIGLIGRAIGIMASVGQATSHQLENREDRMHRDASVILALAHELRPVRIKVSADRRRATSDDYLLLEVMNISRAGPGLVMAPRADPTDGWFNLVSATIGERARLKRALAESIGGIARRTALSRGKIRSLHLEFGAGEFRLDDKVVWSRDARPRGSRVSPVCVEISLKPAAAEVLLPRE